MEFPLHKEWMGEKNRFCVKHKLGVSNFIKFAEKNKHPDQIIICPCSKCENRKLHTYEIVKLHLYQVGMQLGYTFWRHHGETQDTPYVPEIIEDNEVEDLHGATGHRLNDLIDDAFENFPVLHADMPVGNEEASSSTNVNGSVTVLRQFQATQNEADREDIRTDAVSKLCGPDNKGRVRGVSSRMSKKKFLGVQTAKSVMKKACCRSEDAIRAEFVEKFNELNSRLSKLEGSTTSTPTPTPTPTSQSGRTMPTATPTNLSERFDRSRSIEVPSSASSLLYSICSLNSGEGIAAGTAAATQKVGERVHGFKLRDGETVLNVAMVTPGAEEEPIYKEVQGGMYSIGETLGHYIIWPNEFLRPI